MKLPILLILICSVFISFFLAFITCFVIAKITSMPSRKKSEIEEWEFAGARYHVNFENVEKKTKLSQVKIRNAPEEKPAKAFNVNNYK